MFGVTELCAKSMAGPGKGPRPLIFRPNWGRKLTPPLPPPPPPAPPPSPSEGLDTPLKIDEQNLFWQLNLWSCLTQLCLTKHVSKFRWKCAQPFESSFVFLLVQNVILYILFQLTFSINQLLRGCGLLGLYVLLAQFLTLPLTKVYVGDGDFLGKWGRK